MILGKIGEIVKEPFTVLDMANSLVSGIPVSEFTVHLFDPTDSEIYNGSNVTFVELGNGHYYAEFTPNQVGDWMMAVYHPTYFPWGKTDDIQVYINDFDSMTAMIQRILGLTQENFNVDETIYDTEGNMTSSRIRIYNDGVSVGTANDILAVYNVTATYIDNRMETYSVVKV